MNQGVCFQFTYHLFSTIDLSPHHQTTFLPSISKIQAYSMAKINQSTIMIKIGRKVINKLLPIGNPSIQ